MFYLPHVTTEERDILREVHGRRGHYVNEVQQREDGVVVVQLLLMTVPQKDAHNAAVKEGQES